MRTRKKRFMVLGLFAVFAVTVASALFGSFRYTSVCTLCGSLQHTTKYQIFFSSLSLFSHSSESVSPVSSVLAKSGIVPQHQHQWLFCHGGGNGVSCAIGPGRHIRPVVQSTEVAAVIAASQQFGEVQFRDKLLRALFDPKTSEAVRGLGFSVPKNGFSDASSFHAWLSQETESFDQMVTMLQKR